MADSGFILNDDILQNIQDIVSSQQNPFSGFVPVTPIPGGNTQGFTIDPTTGLPTFGVFIPGRGFVPASTALTPEKRALITQQLAAGQELDPILGLLEGLLGPLAEAQAAAAAAATEVSKEFLDILRAAQEASQGLIEQGEPFRKELFDRATRALESGGADVPADLINRAVESAKHATSRTLKDTRENLSSVGLADTPFGARIEGAIGREGRFAESQIKPTLSAQMAQFLINAAQGITSPTIAGGVGLGQSGLGAASGIVQSSLTAPNALAGVLGSLGAAQISAIGNINEAALVAQLQAAAAREAGSGAAASGIGSGIGAAIPAIIAAIAACWVAEALYGHDRRFWFAFWWINFGWQGRVADATRWLYRRVGQRVAGWVRRYGFVDAMLRPLFDRAVLAGARDLAKRYRDGLS